MAMNTASELINTPSDIQAPVAPAEATEAPKRYRSFGNLALITVNLCLSFFFYGYVFFYMGTFQFQVILEIFDIDMQESLALGILIGCIPIGGSVGSLFGRLVIIKFSRRNALLLGNCIAVVSVGLSLIPNFPLLVVCRIVQGICAGLFTSIVPVIVKQIVPVQVSGTFGAFLQLFTGVGSLMSILIQKILTDTTGDQSLYWRISFGLPLITLLVQSTVLIFAYNFQTPKYLLQNDRQSDCKELLTYIYKDEYVEEILHEKKLDLGLSTGHPDPEALKEIQLKKHVSNESLRNVVVHEAHPEKPLHKKTLRYFVAIWVKAGQQLCGSQGMGVYGVYIIGQILPDLEHLVPLFFRILAIVIGLISSLMFSRVGRRRMMQVCTTIAMISQFVTSMGFIVRVENENSANYMILFGFFFLAFAYYMSIGPLAVMYMAEIVSPEFVPIPTFVGWVSAGVISVLLPFFMNQFDNPYPIFLFFAIWCLASLIVNSIFMVETKGKTQKEIYDEYDKQGFCCSCQEEKAEASAKAEASPRSNKEKQDEK